MPLLTGSSLRSAAACGHMAAALRPLPAPFRPHRAPAAPRRPAAAAAAEDDLYLSDDEVDAQGGPLTASQPSTSYTPPDDDGESRALAVALARVAWETKGEDTVVLHVAPLVYWTRYMVISTVFSRPQLNAILAKVESAAEDGFGRRPLSPAAGTSAWELLDFGDVVVHVLTADQRDYYDLESFYGAAEEVDLPFIDGSAPGGPAWETKL